MVNIWTCGLSILFLSATAVEAANRQERHRNPFLAKRIPGLLAIRQGAVSCGGGSFCNPGQFCIPDGCCVNGEVQCTDSTGGCCQAGTVCDGDGCCPKGESCSGGGGVITLPNGPLSGDDDSTSTDFDTDTDTDTDSDSDSFTSSSDDDDPFSFSSDDDSSTDSAGAGLTSSPPFGGTSTGILGGASGPTPSPSGPSLPISTSGSGSSIISGSNNGAMASMKLSTTAYNFAIVLAGFIAYLQ